MTITSYKNNVYTWVILAPEKYRLKIRVRASNEEEAREKVMLRIKDSDGTGYSYAEWDYSGWPDLVEEQIKKSPVIISVNHSDVELFVFIA